MNQTDELKRMYVNTDKTMDLCHKPALLVKNWTNSSIVCRESDALSSTSLIEGSYFLAAF